MTAITLPLPRRRIACFYRPLILATSIAILLGLFWFASRYPQLLEKADHVGQAMPPWPSALKSSTRHRLRFQRVIVP